MPIAPISLCIITANDPHLEKCILSLRPFVSEVCVVINDPKDSESVEVCKRLEAKFEVYTGCNDDSGRIVDFADARNRSFAMATQPWVMWADSDDLVVGGESLSSLLAQAPSNGVFLFPYEYSYAPDGSPAMVHYRERLAPRGKVTWINPVHETLIPKKDGELKFVQADSVVWKHQRQFISRTIEPGRNLRILQKHVEKNPDDVRNMYYIGLEYKNVGDYKNAIKYLSMHVEKSGWKDERAMACYALCEIFERQADYRNALTWAYRSLEIADWFESYYAVCRASYYLKDWQRAARFGRLALQTPPTNTVLFIQPGDRYEIHRFLNIALNNIGQVQEALESCKAGLAGMPGHPELTANALIYQDFLSTKKPVELGDYDPKRLDIVFATHSLEAWDPSTIAKGGIGGSETMLCNMARELAARGHRVRVFAAGSGSFDGVEYRPISEFRELACDVLIVSRYAELLEARYNVASRLTLLWCHDVFAHQATAERLLRADRVLGLSAWHCENLRKTHNLSTAQVIQTRNGIDYKRFRDRNIARNPFKCVNSSSPDRSWPVLLTLWPRIKSAVPKAELHLYYGFDSWLKSAPPAQRDLIATLQRQIKETDGVVFHGRINQDELASEFLSAGVWVHPTWFTETSCITAMEARAAGLKIVTSNLAALKETASTGVLLDGDWTSPQYQDRFVEETIKALLDPYDRTLDESFALDTLACDWEKMITGLIEEKKTRPVIPYHPSRAYKTRPKTTTLVKLNIAAGPNVFPFDGWVNFDKYDFSQYFAYISDVNTPLDGMPEHQRILTEYLRDGGEVVFKQQDCTKPFSIESDSVDFIYGGQMIEHLNPISQTPAFLKECHRMLKPGGIIRLTTPDLDLLVRAYTAWASNIDTFKQFEADQPAFFKEADPASKLAFLLFGACGPDCTQEKYEGHFFAFSQGSLTRFLTEAGFKDIEFTFPKCGKNKAVAMEITDCGISHSLIVEAVKGEKE